MRPIKLTMTAFGPYAGTTVIDFGELRERHLFLICGSTGAGKTTILDAMCYALYGKTAGDRNGARMRSDYADTSQKTEVIFDFALGDAVYRVRRSPEQQIDKKKGGGQTISAMKSSLAKLENEKEVGAVTKDVEAESTRLLGLNASQFCQVVLLPQGDFRKLLVAKAEERESILKQLFKTQRFSEFQEELNRRCKSASEDAERTETEKSALLKSLDIEDGFSLREAASAIKREVTEAQAAVQAAQVLYDRFRREYETATDIQNHRTAYERAAAERARLTAQTPQIESMKKELLRIRAAKTLTAYHEQLEKIHEEGQSESAAAKEYHTRLHAYRRLQEELDTTERELEKEAETQKERQQETALLKEKEPLSAQYETAENAWKQTKEAQEKAEQQKKKGESAQAAAKISADNAKKAAETLRARYIFGQAALLASALKDGDPCPVCGSRSHPHPAISAESLPTEEEVKAAESAADRLRMEYDSVTAELSTFLAGSYGTALQSHAKAQATLHALSDLPPLYRDKKALQARIFLLEKEISSYETRRIGHRKRREDNQRALSAYEEKATASDKRISLLRQQYKEEQESLLIKLNTLGFVDKTDWLSALQFQEKESALENAVTAHRAELIAVENTFAAEKEWIRDKPVPDMPDYQKKDRDWQETLRTALKKAAEKETRSQQLIAAEKRWNTLEEKSKKQEKAASLLLGLYRLTSGKKNRITLERYVLGTLLDEVTKAANLRLQKMSHSRYTLRRMRDNNALGKGGLSLEVTDSYTGRARPANTLSGGETFLASLSLALGLADVVQAKQGGIRLDTMFIDEGFGTLDPEALNSAMNTLIDLQNSGRLVGIISHVPELAERIDARLCISSGDRGSLAHFEID